MTAYVENEDYVPNPTDMIAQFNTSGLGAHGRIEEVASIFQIDKVATAKEIKAALDPEDTTVDSSRVILPADTTDNDEAAEALTARADATLDKAEDLDGTTPAEAEAAEEGDKGEALATAQERTNSSTGHPEAGQHTGPATTTAAKTEDKPAKKTTTSKKAESKKADDKS